MYTNERQLAMSLLEGLREDLAYARLNNSSRMLDVADLRQYIYERLAGSGETRTSPVRCGAMAMYRRVATTMGGPTCNAGRQSRGPVPGTPEYGKHFSLV